MSRVSAHPIGPSRSDSAIVEARLSREASAIRKLPASLWREDRITAALASYFIVLALLQDAVWPRDLAIGRAGDAGRSLGEPA